MKFPSSDTRRGIITIATWILLTYTIWSSWHSGQELNATILRGQEIIRKFDERTLQETRDKLAQCREDLRAK